MSAKIYSSRTADKFVVRLPDGMRDLIDTVSKANHRSMHSEIISRLEISLNSDDVAADDAGTELSLSNELPVATNWIPQAEQLVLAVGFRGVFVLKHFEFDKAGEIYVKLTNGTDKPLVHIDKVAPFVINR